MLVANNFLIFFKEFLKRKQLFHLVKRIFQYPSPGQCNWIFCLVETVCFGQFYFTASRNHNWDKEKTVLRERAHYCQYKTGFPVSENHFFLYFWGLVPVILFIVQWKSLFQRNTSYGLVEMGLWANGNHFLLFIGFPFKWRLSIKLVKAYF